MAGFNPDDYVDVAQRIQDFKAAYPEGRLRGEGEFVRNAAGEIVGYHYVAYAHTEPGDELPAMGTAYEPIPGKTTFTKDSEVMNAETSAWGRAIVALGFPTKKIASADEVRNRQPSKPAVAGGADSSSPGGAGSEDGLTASLLAAAEKLAVKEGKPEIAIQTSDAIELSKKDRTAPQHEAWLRQKIKDANEALAVLDSAENAEDSLKVSA